MKKSSGKKRVSSLTFLIATTAVLAAVAVLCLFGSNLLYAMRVRNVNEQRAEVEKRNTERYEAYRQEVQELQDRLTANNNISTDWPQPDTQEGISIVDLTNYPLDNPGTVTVSRQDVMLGGLLLVNSSLVHEREYRDDIRVVKVPMTEIAAEHENPKGANIVMMGAMAANSDLFTEDDLERLTNEFFEKKGKINPKNSLCFRAGTQIH